MLLALLLLVPLGAGLLCLAARKPAGWERIHVAASAMVLVLAGRLAFEVLERGVVTAGDGFLRADALSALVVILIAFVAFVAALYAVGYFREEEERRRATMRQLHRYYTLAPLFVAAMLLVVLADNLGIMWVAIEGTTLVSVLLVAFNNERASLEAAWKYVIIGSVGITLALFGTILTYYSAVGVLGDTAPRGLYWSVLMPVADRFNPQAMRLAFVLVLVGYGTKAGLVPMHTWKPDAYAEAPVPAAALLGAAFVNCAIYSLIRFTLLAGRCLGPEFPGRLLIGFGIVSVLVAAPFVLVQRNFRRLLAYSSIDHAGLMVAAVGFGGKLGALGAALHMVFHAVTKPLLFFCVGNVQQQYRTPYFRKVTGVIRTLPWTGTLLLLATLAVTGTPPFGLFQSEFTILSAALVADRPGAAALLVVGLVAIFAGFLVHMARLNLGQPREGVPRAGECPWKLGAIVIAGGVVIVLGLWLPGPLFALIQESARIIGGAL
jgi:hydrogenase-4 component F